MRRLAIALGMFGLLAWAVLTFALFRYPSSLDQVTKDGDVRFFPRDSPSVIGQDLLERGFPQDAASSQVVIVYERSGGPLTRDDFALVEKQAADFHQFSESNPELGVKTLYTYRSPVIGPRLIGKSAEGPGQAVLTIVSLRGTYLSKTTRIAVDRILGCLDKSPPWPPGLRRFVTGSAVVGHDMNTAVNQSIDSTTNTKAKDIQFADLDPDRPSVIGAVVLRRYFAAGEFSPTVALVENSRIDFRSPAGWAAVAEVSRRLLAIPGVAEVRSVSQPLGKPLGEPPAADWKKTFLVRVMRAAADAHYVSTNPVHKADLNHITRFDIVFKSDPFSESSWESLEAVRQLLTAATRPGEPLHGSAKIGLAGATSAMNDLKNKTTSDQQPIATPASVSAAPPFPLAPGSAGNDNTQGGQRTSNRTKKQWCSACEHGLCGLTPSRAAGFETPGDSREQQNHLRYRRT
jgi:uncharacterized membrane protein YdfJ with MMPL/SSD domain